MTMRFMMIVKADPSYEAGRPPDPALIAAIGKFSEAKTKAGVLLQTGGLLPSSRGARVWVSGGRMTVTDGPFAETKELIGGFAILEASSKEEAIRLGKEFMQLHVDVLGQSYEGTRGATMATPSTPSRNRRAVRRRFTRAQILGLLREAAAGTPLMDLCWNHCISRSTFRAWKAKYGAARDVKTGQLQQLELENARLRSALARANSDLEHLCRQSRGAPLLPARTRSIASYRPSDGPSRASGLHDAD
jgi:hypothetical protein